MTQDESPEVSIALLKERVQGLLDREKARATREWTIITTMVGLLATIVVKSLGWM